MRKSNCFWSRSRYSLRRRPWESKVHFEWESDSSTFVKKKPVMNKYRPTTWKTSRLNLTSGCSGWWRSRSLVFRSEEVAIREPVGISLEQKGNRKEENTKTRRWHRIARAYVHHQQIDVSLLFVSTVKHFFGQNSYYLKTPIPFKSLVVDDMEANDGNRFGKRRHRRYLENIPLLVLPQIPIKNIPRFCGKQRKTLSWEERSNNTSTCIPSKS